LSFHVNEYRLIFACQIADTCREMLLLAVQETITNLTVFFGKHITVMETQMPILIIIIIQVPTNLEINLKIKLTS
jgi:hypothetical protein